MGNDLGKLAPVAREKSSCPRQMVFESKNSPPDSDKVSKPDLSGDKGADKTRVWEGETIGI